ncbi:hypothetical protein RMSM_04826 [Rhodopirellula maiorica SM1]|uniref:Uncharacterized protein n=1 Tax=Rhodopirellula maiorica SM1 TaxID=1265738 RepID=M5RFV3_9BACT|nr:hypothetical protein RMSM_04826 [Rhodopirellula maiorica SM1]
MRRKSNAIYFGSGTARENVRLRPEADTSSAVAVRPRDVANELQRPEADTMTE